MTIRAPGCAALLGALLLLAGSCGPLPELPAWPGQPPLSPEAAPAPSAHQALELEVHERVNRYRVQRGLQPLDYDSRIAEIARRHSEEMAAGSRPLGHDGFQERSAAVGRIIRLRAMAENVAYDSRARVGEQVVAGWIGSPGHLHNIEEASYDLTGVGVARDPDGLYYFTQLFVTRAR